MSRGIWRRQLRGLMPALLVFALNLGLLSVYRLVFAGEARARGQLVRGRQTEVADLAVQRRKTEELVERVRRNEVQIREFRSQRLATEEQRLTQVLAEVKKLARQAGVEPSSIRYPEERMREVGMTKRSIVFSVDGDYAGLRRFINFLELSELFLALEEVSLAGRSGDGGGLRISLEVSTLFLDPEAAAPAAGERATS